MIGEVKWYCLLKKTEQCFIGYNETFDPKGYHEIKKSLVGVPLRIVDVAVDNSGFLVLDSLGRALVDVRSMDDVDRYFLCDEFGGVLIPTGLSTEEKIIQSTRRLGRKGGYNETLRKMVIAASLCKREFNDDFLFSKQ
jgi:hypothetical protein